MSNTTSNHNQRKSSTKDNCVIDFLSAIENDFELSKEEFNIVCYAIPLESSKNIPPHRINRNKNSLLSVLRLW